MRLLQIVLDAVLVSLAFLGSYLIRFDGRVDGPYLHQLTILIPALVCLRLLANWGFGVYRRLWRYTGLTEIMELGCACLLYTSFMQVMIGVSRSVYKLPCDSRNSCRCV